MADCRPATGEAPPQAAGTPSHVNTEEYEKMYSLEDTYWWFQGRMHIIEAILAEFMTDRPRAGRVLDLGCGTGLMLERLAKFRPAGLDFSPLSLQFCRQRGARNLMRGDVTALPLEDGSMDLVLALDLIEHVEHDDAMLVEVERVLRPGGWFMASVPAHQWLWSDHDVSLHHFRRYSYDGFKARLVEAGLEPVKYSFGITLSFLPVVVFRMMQRLWQSSIAMPNESRPKTHLIPLPWFVNTPLIWALRAEGAALRRMNLPVGVSLLALCRKPTHSR